MGWIHAGTDGQGHKAYCPCGERIRFPGHESCLDSQGKMVCGDCALKDPQSPESLKRDAQNKKKEQEDLEKKIVWEACSRLADLPGSWMVERLMERWETKWVPAAEYLKDCPNARIQDGEVMGSPNSAFGLKLKKV